MTNVYVGNLSFRTTEDELRSAFEEFGQVERVSIVMDKDSGRSRGFGFVEMADQSAAQSAIDALNGKDLGGRVLTVNEARPKAEGGDRGGQRH